MHFPICSCAQPGTIIICIGHQQAHATQWMDPAKLMHSATSRMQCARGVCALQSASIIVIFTVGDPLYTPGEIAGMTICITIGVLVFVAIAHGC